MTDDKRKEITESLGLAKWLLVIGGLVILFMPFILTSNSVYKGFNLTTYGQIGDTIGGITAPFLNLIGAFLVFYALKAQVKANELIQDQIDKDNEIKEIENGSADQEDNVLKNAPHTAEIVSADEWAHSYSRSKAAYPLDWIREKKYWVPVGRVDNAWGDRNLICTCGSPEEYEAFQNQ